MVDVIFLVGEIEDEGARFAGRDAVEPGESLNRLHAGQALHHIHRLQQGLIEAGLILLRDEKDPVVVASEGRGECAFGQTVIHRHFGVGRSRVVRVLDRARESHQRTDAGIVLLLGVAIKSQLVFHGGQAGACDHHGLRAPAEFVHHRKPKMLDDDGNDLLDIDRMQLQVARKDLRGLPARHIGIVLDLFDQAEEAFVGGVVLKHIHDKPFLDGLPHGVLMERRSARWARFVEQGLRLEFRGGREGKETEIRLPGALQRIAQNRRLRVLGEIIVLFVGELGGNGCFDPGLVQHAPESGRSLSALGRVRLIHDDGEPLCPPCRSAHRSLSAQGSRAPAR